MNFSPALITNNIVDPLRLFFAQYGGTDLTWTSDPKTSKVEVDSINNFHKVAIQAKPRVLISRGSFSIRGSGLADNLAEGDSLEKTKGLRDTLGLVFIDGQAQILIEARQEGTAERLVDMVSHFVVWAREFYCNYKGFKQFAQTISVSPVTPSREDLEIFQCSIGLPWSAEDSWHIRTDGVKIKDILLQATKLPG